jgi:hypothetical protein
MCHTYTQHDQHLVKHALNLANSFTEAAKIDSKALT